MDALPASEATPWAEGIDALTARLDVNIAEGLSAAEVKARLHRYGENRLRRVEQRSSLAILIAQLKSAVVGLLLVGAAISFAFGQNVEGLAIAAVIVLNTILGFFTELRAVRSMEALRELGQVTADVRRGGELQRVPATRLVPGDVVLLEAGDVVTADLRVIDASALAADESALTGESVPVDKGVEPVSVDAVLADRSSMLFKGTTVTRGAAEGLVVGTGMQTELGRISALVEEAEDQETPLERRIETLGRQLMGVSLLFVALTAGLGIVRGQDLFLMIESAIALAVATVPEGLPIVTTIALARGMWRMARRNVLVEQLGAVETLGSTNLILSDKTGTLTENRMRASRLLVHDREVQLDGERLCDAEGAPLDEASLGLVCQALRTASATSEATVGRGGKAEVGDPMEVALVEAGERHGVFRDELLDREPELREIAFDSGLKMSATEHKVGSKVRIAVKGAPEAVLRRCTRVMTEAGPQPFDEAERERWEELNQRSARAGLRVLALAQREADRELEPEEVYEELTLLGLVGLSDPPRTVAKRALDAARAAGVRVVMATGDQAATALAIAAAVGLVEKEGARVLQGADVPRAPASALAVQRALAAEVVARASPEQKLRLLRLHQNAGAVVAMLGDGVNDAPALRQADIGVAMGKRGTQVARQAADMVLEDDELASVIAAIEQGRVIFANLRAFVVYLLGCNLAEILVLGLAAAVGWALPILPLQILFLNLITDVFPAAALGVGEGDSSVMRWPPRDPDEPFLTRDHWQAVVLHAVLITAAVLGAYGITLSVLGLSPEAGVTVAFATLGFAQLWHVFDMADRHASALVNDVTKNPWVWGAVVLCVALMLAGLFAPGLSDLLGVISVPPSAWCLVLLASLMPMMIVQAGRAVWRLVSPSR